jgi:hypothetical protein
MEDHQTIPTVKHRLPNTLEVMPDIKSECVFIAEIITLRNRKEKMQKLKSIHDPPLTATLSIFT